VGFRGFCGFWYFGGVWWVLMWVFVVWCDFAIFSGFVDICWFWVIFEIFAVFGVGIIQFFGGFRRVFGLLIIL